MSQPPEETVPEESVPALTEDGRVVVGQDEQRRRILGSLVGHPELDRWVDLSVDGQVRIFTGKVELGQGIRTALTLLAAEELGVDPALVEVVPATTDEGPDEGFTAGSRSVEQSGVAVRQACAHVRRLLVERAAARFGVPADRLSADDGVVRGPDGPSVSYWELAAERPFRTRVTDPAPLRPAAEHRFVGRGMPRVDLRDKIGGEPAYVPDLRLPGMRFARVVRPRRCGAVLAALPPAAVGEAEVVRRGSFVAVVAATEAAAASAAAELASRLEWAEDGPPFPAQAADPDYMAAHVVASYPIVGGVAQDTPPEPRPDPGEGAARVVTARYTKPFLLHGSIGPSAAVALSEAGRLTVWSHSQGIGFLRRALAPVVDLPVEQITVHHLDGAGCYGHNGADDAALDAALVATALPGSPVSLRWSRDDEHATEPMGAAMAVDLAAGLDGDGRIAIWCQEILTHRHNSRPIPQPKGTRLLAGWSLDPPIERSRAAPMFDFEAGGHRNGTPAYDLGTSWIVKRDVDDGTALRTSSLRGLGAPGNVFAIESFMEELAEAAGTDPVTFRLAHLADPRARAVIEAAVDMAGGMEAPGGLDAPGRGLGFARYENSMAYVAVVMELDVDPRTAEIHLRHAWIAADAGEIVDPDGLTNQLEGGLVQSASWTLFEQVRFDERGVASRDWESYPIMRFSQVPEVETRLLDHPGEAPLGSGEASGGPTVAAIASAFHQHTGARVRDLPLDPPRVMSALDALL
ncbi:MAG: molybdopterin cofactor-binding domain-containing protein [Acidimicrobiales bacterium]